jgi:hypothetical protein
MTMRTKIRMIRTRMRRFGFWFGLCTLGLSACMLAGLSRPGMQGSTPNVSNNPGDRKVTSPGSQTRHSGPRLSRNRIQMEHDQGFGP